MPFITLCSKTPCLLFVSQGNKRWSKRWGRWRWSWDWNWCERRWWWTCRRRAWCGRRWNTGCWLKHVDRLSAQIWGSVAATQQGPLGQRPHGAVWQQHSVWQEGWVSQSLDDYCPLSFKKIEWVIGSFRQIYTCCYLTLKQHRSCKIILFKFPLLNHAGNHVWTNGCQHEAKSTSPAGNVFWKSTAWKRQVVQDVTMCPRSDMFKPNSGNKKLRMEAALTDIQEAKQVLWLSLSWSFHNLIYLESVYYFDVCFPCHVLIDLQKVNFSIRLTINVPTNPLNPFEATAGTDLVKKCVQGLVAGTTVDRLALVDAYGYDAFPALSTLEARLGSKHWADSWLVPEHWQKFSTYNFWYELNWY